MTVAQSPEAPLVREYLPATGPARQDLLLLHGWGGSRELWRPLLATLRRWANVTLVDLPGLNPVLPSAGNADFDALVARIADAAPARGVVLGWSLGGQLAAGLAQRYPQRVEALVTLCSNPRFVADGDWPGMQPAVFASFRAHVERDAAAALRRFAGLQAGGAASERPLLRSLRAGLPRCPDAGVTAGLDWLAALDTRDTLRGLEQPQLHLFSGGDRLLPRGVAAALGGLLGAAAEVGVLPCGSHAAALEAPAGIAGRLQGFLERRGLLRDEADPGAAFTKRDVAESFSRAAPGYDSAAALQRAVGDSLLRLLDREGAPPAVRVLDLGCGTGHFRPGLQARFPGADYLGLDLAPGMVTHARARADTPDRDGGEARWLVADAETLPLAAGSVDLVFSSLALQWCQRPALFLAELARVLRPGGLCVFSTLGPGTLAELRAAWTRVDGHRHVNRFTPAATLAQAAEPLGDVRLSLSQEIHRMQYPRALDLLRELKALGAHNMNVDRPAGLTGRRRLQTMFDAYETFREDGGLPATYDVILGAMRRP